MFFEIFMTGPLGASLDYTDAQNAKRHWDAILKIILLDQKNNTKLMKHCAIYIAMSPSTATEYSGLATLTVHHYG